MKVRIIARFKNEEFYQARKRANLIQQELADLVGISLVTIINYENFRAYPINPETKGGRGRRFAHIAKNLEKILKVPWDVLFPEEYRIAIDKKLGKPIHAIHEFLELPEAYVEKNFILPDPADTYEFKELKNQVNEMLKTLTEREAKILKMRFGLGDGNEHTLEEVGQQFRVTRDRIRQIEVKALGKLKHPSRSKSLKEFI